VAAIQYTFTHKHPVAEVQYTFTHKHPVAAVQYTFTHKHPVAEVQYTFTHTQYTEQHKTNNTKNNTKIWEECGPCPVLASYTLAFALQLSKTHGRNSVRAAEECQLAR
jgi:hypothetical protein